MLNKIQKYLKKILFPVLAPLVWFLNRYYFHYSNISHDSPMTPPLVGSIIFQKEVELTDRKNLLHKEPSVIDDKLVRECLEKMFPDDQIGALAKKEGVDPRRATELLIEFKNIAQIANISHMVNLTKLQLPNNIIQRIEGLETLINLVHLDLSYNCIRNIQGLASLKKLEVLCLHHNLMTTLEGLDDLLKLEILTISSNNIQELENVKYLRRFTRLRGLCFGGNPVCAKVNFRQYLLAFVPQVTRLDYKMIPQEEKASAREAYKQEIAQMEEKEDVLRRRYSVVEAEERVRDVQRQAFVEDFAGDTLWELLFEEDVAGRTLLAIGETEDFQEMYMELFRRASQELFEKGMRAFTARTSELGAFEDAIKEEKMAVREIGISLTEGFLQYEKGAVGDMMDSVTSIEELTRKFGSTEPSLLPPEFSKHKSNLNELVVSFVRAEHRLWYEIMENEVHLHEQIIDRSKELERNLQELVSFWSEHLTSNFATLSDLERQFNAKFKDTLISPEGEIRVDLAKTDPETSLAINRQPDSAVAERLNSSHQVHLKVIETLEQKMMDRMTNWWQNTIENFHKNERQRNRMRISEISHFVDWHRVRLDELGITRWVDAFVSEVRANQDRRPEVEVESELEMGSIENEGDSEYSTAMTAFKMAQQTRKMTETAKNRKGSFSRAVLAESFEKNQ